jgi:hypothetical protein
MRDAQVGGGGGAHCARAALPTSPTPSLLPAPYVLSPRASGRGGRLRYPCPTPPSHRPTRLPTQPQLPPPPPPPPPCPASTPPSPYPPPPPQVAGVYDCEPGAHVPDDVAALTCHLATLSGAEARAVLAGPQHVLALPELVVSALRRTLVGSPPLLPALHALPARPTARGMSAERCSTMRRGRVPAAAGAGAGRPDGAAAHADRRRHQHRSAQPQGRGRRRPGSGGAVRGAGVGCHGAAGAGQGAQGLLPGPGPAFRPAAPAHRRACLP